MLWGVQIWELAAIDNDAPSAAPGDNEFISKAGVASQAAVRKLHDNIKASGSVELWSLRQMSVGREAGDGQVSLI